VTNVRLVLVRPGWLSYLRSVLPSFSRARALIVTGLGAAVLAATVGVPVADAAPVAPVAPVVLQASGPYAAASSASLLTVDVPSLAGTLEALLPQTNVVLGNSVAGTDSDGDADGDTAEVQRTFGTAGTTGSNADNSNVLGTSLQLDSAYAGAPPSTVDDPPAVIPVPAAPLLDLGLLDAYAEANWVSDTECVASDVPLSLAEQSLADLEVLIVPDSGSVVATGPGAVSSTARNSLVSIPGANDPRAVQATSTANVASARVLDALLPGVGSLLAVDVERNSGVAVPDITAQASGIAGGASVTYADNVVTVRLADTVLAVLDSENLGPEETTIGLTLQDIITTDLTSLLDGIPGIGDIPLDAILNPLGDTLRTVLLELEPVIRLSIPRETVESADGTFASGSTALLRIEVLPPDITGASEPIADGLNTILGALGLDITQPLASIDLGPSAASASAPAGGITCGDDSNPLEVNKVNSGPAVPGSSFDYTIAVGNVGECAMDPVRVVDVVEGPTGTTIGITEPAGATVTDLGNGDWRIEWANVGPIAPDGRTTLRVRVNVGANAPVGERFTDTVTGTASIVSGPGCTPRDVTRTVVLPEPEVVGRPSGPCNITGSTKGKSHLQVYPGESFVYYVNVLNGGGEPCTNVTVVDPIDSRLTFESCSDGCTFTAPNASWNIGTLAPGQSVTLRLQVKVNDGATGTLANTATIDSAETPPTNVSVSGPDITTNSEQSPGNPARIPNRDLARTGGPSTIPAPVLLALGLAAVGAWNLRRRLAG
jgi:uncharacterized repeat protein (TIGR01451 family)